MTKANVRYLSTADAAAYMGLQQQTIRRWVRTGRINGRRVGPKLFFVDTRDLDAMVTVMPATVKRTK